MIKGYDYIIIGAGIYGLYAAKEITKNKPNAKICIVEIESKPFQRASYINQARVHNGYHYPRSLLTALKSAEYYNRFIHDYSFAINKKFEKIYSIAENFSFSSGENFEQFCNAAKIPCEKIKTDQYLKDNVIEASYITEEFSMDAMKILEYFLERLQNYKNVEFKFETKIEEVENKQGNYYLKLNDSKIFSNFIINSSYASVNQIINLFGFDMFDIKYEIAEIALCNVSNNFENLGITVMDGPFFSLMPFGLTGLHSLSSVQYTPHKTCYSNLPKFDCQNFNEECSETSLYNCNNCNAKPKTAWNNMEQLAKKFLNEDIKMNYEKSLFAIKPILISSEVSDSRPTLIKEFSKRPRFISILSGKFNTMYDLEKILNY
ncbi:FAD-dependent oxidoreductase [Candidatus Marinimicrobia bacterium]|nr:FAD-dependent oxidoreductase [Candidatus Neomarinimicrobiota bacterium]